MTADVPDMGRLADLDADIAAGLAADPGPTVDPASRAVLDALAATRAELAALPEVPVPPEFAARWAAALPTGHSGDGASTGRVRRRVLRTAFPPLGRAGASADRRFGARRDGSGRERTEPVITRRPHPDGPGRPPGRRRRVRPAVAVGLALAGLLIVAGVLQPRSEQEAVTASDLGSIALATVGTHDAGELTDPVRRAACLRSVRPPGLDPRARLLGGRGVVLDGRPGIVLVLATGQLGRFRVVVVDPACGPDGGTLLADTLIGR